MALLEAQSLKKIYTTRFGGHQVQALSNVSFSVEQGEYVAIMGESGSGKTTLLNILATLDRPTSGRVILGGKSLSDVSEKRLAAFRRNNLGFVFQDFNLLDTFTLKDNIFLPLVLGGKDYKEMEQRLVPVAQKLGITDILAKYPYEVSGGQKQRAASLGKNILLMALTDCRQQRQSIRNLLIQLLIGAVSPVNLVKHLAVLDKKHTTSMTGRFRGMCYHQYGLAVQINLVEHPQHPVR